jgi:cyclophilin family peptidyl-prolyl cis-trans isomerase
VKKLSRTRRQVKAFRAACEELESRRLLTYQLVSPLADVAVTTAASSTVSLAGHFHDPSATNTTVLLHFQPYDTASDGADVMVQLSDSVTPQTVANFLAYVNAGLYNNTIIHRSVSAFIVQGGGFSNASGLPAINTFSAVVNEFANDFAAASNGPVNIRGTIAMAKLSGDPNSATDQWFINLADNSSNLDNQNGGFTTFGTVVGTGMNVFDTITTLPQTNLGDPFTNLPLAGDGTGSYANLVTLTYATAESTYTITGNTNPSLFSSVSVVGSQLQLNYAPDQVGSADITVTATDFNGHILTDTFTASVTQPAIGVTDGGTTLTDSQATADSLGSAAQGATVSKTLRVTNNGNADLTFTAPTVPTGYMITSPADLSAVTVTPGNFVDIVVSSVATNTGGTTTGTLVLNSNDPDVAAFHIPLTYTVLSKQATVSYNSGSLTNGQSSAVNFGSSSAASFPVTLVVKNTGNSTLTLSAPTLPAGYSIVTGLPGTLAAGASANLVLGIDTTTVGTKAGMVVINSDDPVTPAFSFPVTATVSHAIIGVSLLDETVSPATVVGPVSSNQSTPIDYGFVDQNSVTPNSKTFRITNTGTTPLVLGTILEPAGFFVTSPDRTFHSSGPSTPPNLGTLAVGASVDVTITQRADTGGDKSGTLVFQSNDPNTPSFDLPLTGFTHYKKLDVSVNSVELTANATTHQTQSVSVGTALQGSTLQVTLHVTNTGDTLDLSLGTPTLPSGFSVVTALPDTLAAGASADLVLAVDTSVQGAISGNIVINSSDPLYALSPSGFIIPVTGLIHYHHLVATNAGSTVTSGSTVNFGTILTGDTGQEILHLTNNGDVALTLGTPVIPAGYSLIGSLPTTLAAGASVDAVLQIDSTTRGSKSGVFSITTDDVTATNFQVTLAGTVIFKGLGITLGDGTPVLYGMSTAIDFGTVRKGDTSHEMTFEVTDTGHVSMSIQAVTLPSGYSIVTGLPSTLAPGETEPLVIRLDASAPGYDNSTMHIVSSDPDRPSFDIPLKAAVTLPVKLGVGGMSSITFTDADGTVSTVTMSGPGSATLDFLGNNLASVVKKKVATIAGSSVILSGITFAGTNAAKTKVTITSKGGKVKTVDIGNISGSAISSLTASSGRLIGTLAGKIGTLSLAAMAGATVNLGAGSVVNVPTITSSNFTITGNLKSLNVATWTGGSLTAGSIDSLIATGAIKNVALVATKSVGTITVKGNLQGCSLRSAGKITSINVGALMGSTIYAGINPAKSPLTDALPFSTNAVLASLITKSFTNSTIAARTITSLSLGTVKTHNSGTPEGIAGHTIASLIAKLDTGKSIKLSKVNTKVNLTTQLKAQKATTLNDLKIVIA